MEKCLCGRLMVNPVGPTDAKVLIVGDRPDFEDLQKNMPFLSRRGEVLRGELSKAGIDIRKCRLTFIWRHEIAEDCKGHMGEALREMRLHPYVLLMGAETLKSLAISNTDLRIGLRVSSIFIPDEVKICMAVTNPPQNSGVGEFRLALTKFARLIEEEEHNGE